VKRGFFAVIFVLGLAAAGLSTSALAAAEQDRPAPQTEPKPKTLAPVAPAPATLPPRVRVGGTVVGGLTVTAAERTVRKSFAMPLSVVVDGRRFRIDPTKLGKAYVEGAVARTKAAKPGARIPLAVSVDGRAVRAWAVRLSSRLERHPKDAVLRLRDGKPFIVRQRYGRKLDRGELVRRVAAALAANDRRPVRLRTKKVVPRALANGFGAVIVIERGKNMLSLYRGARLWRTFDVATGQSAYPTPRGRFEIVTMWRNPWWYPPPSDWAQGLEPVPPGPANPLGTRWMGISAPSVGIHGTPQPQSIGYSVSHGCVRMLVPEAEWLFERVSIGTTVFVI
jgi:lipoprotein-anchoring transpeptidase ErfK/SrfK